MLKCTDLKQKGTAKELNASTPADTAVRKKLELEREMDSLGIGKCGRKRKTLPRLDRKITAMALGSRRASCKELSMELANDGVMVDRRTTNNRHFEQSLKSYRPRKKSRLTQKARDINRMYSMKIGHQKIGPKKALDQC